MTDTIPLDKLARVYIKIRTKIGKLTRDYETQVADLQEQQREIVLAMKDQMLELGTQSVRTGSGTISLTKKTRYIASDWEEFKQFMIENDAVDLLEKRIAQLNMARFLEENPGLVPPGLNSNTEYSVMVTKPRN